MRLALLLIAGLTLASEAKADPDPPSADATRDVITPEPLNANAAPPSQDEARVQGAAKAHYERAMKAYDAGHFYDAARSFDAAYAALQRPVFLLNAARAWERASDPYEALVRFKQLAKHPETSEALRHRARDGAARILSTLRREQRAHPKGADVLMAPTATPGTQADPTPTLEWEWVGLRLFAGVFNLTDTHGGWFFESDTAPLLTGELVLFTMLWDWGYWDILRVGGGYPMYLTWGGSIGYRQRWGDDELRTGVHITNLLFPLPISSGLEAFYIRRFEHLNVEAGVRIYAYPPSLGAFVGVKF